MTYVLSLGVGLFVGVAYGLLGVRSPAPPIIALLGLLGMLAGEAAVQYWRGHPDALASLFHTKSFGRQSPMAEPENRAPTSASLPGGPPA